MASSKAVQTWSLALVAGLVTALLVAAGAFDYGERDVFDILARVGTTPGESSDLVSIIMLDEASLDWGKSVYEHARRQGTDVATDGGLSRAFLFPWDRRVYDFLIDFLAQGGARVFALDVELAGPHPSGDPSGDATLGLTSSMQNEFGEPFVVHALNFETSAGPAVELWEPDVLETACLAGSAIDVAGLDASPLPFDRSDEGPYSNPILPYEAILEGFEGTESLTRLGVVTPQPDRDAVIRRARPLVQYQGRALPSLGLAAALAYADSEGGPGAIDLSIEGGELVLSGADPEQETRLPLTASGDLLIRWRDDGREAVGDAPAGRFPTYPAHRVLRSYMKARGLPGWDTAEDDRPGYFMDPSEFAGRIVFLGANAAGLRDLKATPVSEDYPGVKVHAAVAEAALLGEAIARPGPAVRGVLAGALAAVAMLVTLRVRSQLGTLLAVLALAMSWVGVAALAYRTSSLWLDVIGPVFGVAIAFTGGTTFNYFTEGRRSREISGLFQHFAPPAVVRQLIARPENIALRGETREITSFFSDIRSFTSLSNTPEMRADPGRLTDHLNAYLSEMTRAITDCGGTLDKYIGDAVVAIFGAPVSIENHAEAACRAALECQRRLADFNARAAEAGLPPFVTRIGLRSGEATVGCVGSRDRYSYTAIGPTVNFASRLEGVNKAYGTLVLAGGTTRRMVGDALRFRLLDRVRVPGIPDDGEPLEVHEVLEGPDVAGALSVEAVATFERGRGLYAEGRFAEAAGVLEELAESLGDGPSRALAARCRQLAQDPPEGDWDGVHRIEGK